MWREMIMKVSKVSKVERLVTSTIAIYSCKSDLRHVFCRQILPNLAVSFDYTALAPFILGLILFGGRPGGKLGRVLVFYPLVCDVTNVLLQFCTGHLHRL